MHAAFTLTGEDKARTIAEILGAVAVAAPERVGWLTAEAEAAARSIEDASGRANALAGIAWAVAVADPQRAEAIADSIEDAPTRANALASIAGAVMVDDPDHSARLAAGAEAAARSIEDAPMRADTQTQIRRETYFGRMSRFGQMSRHHFRSWDWPQQMSMMDEIAVMAATDPWRAEIIARSIEDAPTRTNALAEVAWAVAAADPEQAAWLAAEAEAAARSIEDAPTRANALAKIIRAVTAADPQRAEAIANSIEDASTRAKALAGLVHHLAQQEHLLSRNTCEKTAELTSSRDRKLPELPAHRAMT